MRRIWGLADLHLSFAHPKPMDIFGDHWRNHSEKIAENCRKVIDDHDILLIPGDISWALKRPEAEQDLAWIAAEMPGIKVLSKGNHDYWWDSDRPLNYPGLCDTPYISDDAAVGVAAIRGWVEPSILPEAERPQAEKIVAREQRRLEKRLQAIDSCALRLAMIHYPPIQAFADLLRDHGVATVVYGHLHLNRSTVEPPKDWNGLRILCVACDRLDFAPALVATLP